MQPPFRWHWVFLALGGFCLVMVFLHLLPWYRDGSGEQLGLANTFNWMVLICWACLSVTGRLALRLRECEERIRRLEEERQDRGEAAARNFQ